jgi:hypothetical protein
MDENDASRAGRGRGLLDCSLSSRAIASVAVVRSVAFGSRCGSGCRGAAQRRAACSASRGEQTGRARSCSRRKASVSKVRRIARLLVVLSGRLVSGAADARFHGESGSCSSSGGFLGPSATLMTWAERLANRLFGFWAWIGWRRSDRAGHDDGRSNGREDNRDQREGANVTR